MFRIYTRAQDEYGVSGPLLRSGHTLVCTEVKKAKDRALRALRGAVVEVEVRSVERDGKEYYVGTITPLKTLGFD